MKEVLKKILSMVLALLVLFSTMSFSIEKHLCAGEVIAMSFTGNLERCGVPDQMDNNNLSDGINKEPCCKDVIQIFKSTNTEINHATVVDFTPVKVMVAFVFSYQLLFQEYTPEKNFFKDYSPPDINKDIQVLYETFLI